MFKNISISKDQHKVKFELHGVNVSIANSIRRVLLVEIPFIAINRDSITFRVEDNNINTSNFHDEFLIHRLSFVRLKADSTMADPSQFNISISDPHSHDLPFVNSSDDNIDFTSDDLIVHYAGKKISPKHIFVDVSLIARLKPGQQLKASMTVNQRAVRIPDTDPAAILSKTRYHYQPCRVKFCYKNPRHDDQKLMTPDDELQFYGHAQKCPKAFVFEICGFQSPLFTPQNLVLMALSVIEEKIIKFKHLAEENFKHPLIHEESTLSVDPLLENSQTLRVFGEGHTLGNMLAEQMRAILQANYPSDENFVSYQKIHPLEEIMVLKIKLPSNSRISHRDLILMTCHQLIDIVTHLKNTWLS